MNALFFPKFFFGRVVSGKGLGRQFGFPTLNLEFSEKPQLEHGVYACFASREKFPALLHFGPRPTISEEKPSFEVFFLDFPEGRNFQELEIEVLGKIRDVMKFDSLEALGKQIQKDKEAAVLEYFSP